jgi:hypothetical protein
MGSTAATHTIYVVTVANNFVLARKDAKYAKREYAKREEAVCPHIVSERFATLSSLYVPLLDRHFDLIHSALEAGLLFPSDRFTL